MSDFASKKDDGFTQTICTYCHQYLHKLEPTAWQGGLPYHKHHTPDKTAKLGKQAPILKFSLPV